MADHGIFIGWRFPARGREEAAVKVFGELIQLLTAQAQQRNIESLEPCFLQAHGGDLGGFVLVKGERAKLDQLVASDEFQRLITRAQTVVENFGVVNALFGQEVQKTMATYLPDTADLR